MKGGRLSGYNLNLIQYKHIMAEQYKYSKYYQFKIEWPIEAWGSKKVYIRKNIM